MKTLIVFTHPNPNSLNHALLDFAVETLERKGHEVKIRDLYSQPFKPILDSQDFNSLKSGKVPEDIAAEQKLVTWATHLLFIYPLWWWDRPAALKGWIDRVWLHGFAYQSGPNGVRGLLQNKKALVIQTAGNTKAELDQNDAWQAIERPMLDGTLRFAGINDASLKTFCSVMSLSEAEHQHMFDEFRSILEKW